jgi:hypothetical protein
MLTIKNIAIKTQNQAEKLASLYFLASKIGCKVEEYTLEDTIKGIGIQSYPFVCFMFGSVAGSSSVADYHVIGFSELSNIDSILEKLNKPKIEVGKRYYYKDSDVQEFVVPISIQNSDEYVVGGCQGNDFNLYNLGMKRTEAETIKLLADYKLRD